MKAINKEQFLDILHKLFPEDYPLRLLFEAERQFNIIAADLGCVQEKLEKDIASLEEKLDDLKYDVDTIKARVDNHNL